MPKRHLIAYIALALLLTIYFILIALGINPLPYKMTHNDLTTILTTVSTF